MGAIHLNISIKSGDVVTRHYPKENLNVHRIIINNEGWYYIDDSGNVRGNFNSSGNFKWQTNFFDLIFNIIMESQEKMENEVF